MSGDHSTGDPELDRMIEGIMDLPDPPEPTPPDYAAMSLADLLDDLVETAQEYGLSNGFDTTEEHVEAARARVDERLKKAGLL